MNEPVTALSIGSIVGGRTSVNQRWRDAIGDLTRRVARARSDVLSPLNVNVVFQVPGNILRPDFEGARTGRFSKAEQLLMVQVALPDEVPEDPAGYLQAALLNAIEEAEIWARHRRLATDLGAIRQIAEHASA